MIRETASNLIKIANNLDSQGDFENADKVTMILESATKGNEEAVRVAQNIFDLANQVGGYWDKITQGAGQVGQGLGTAGQGASGILGAPSKVPGAVVNTAKQAAGYAVDALKQAAIEWLGIQSPQVQPAVSYMKNILDGAIAAHKSGKNGWQVLNASIGALPPKTQNTLKQQFMLSTGEYVK